MGASRADRAVGRGVSEAPDARARGRARLKSLGSVLAFAAGVGLVGWLVRSAGVSNVLHVLARAGRWLPLIVLLEVAMVSFDALAVRGLLGRAGQRVGALRWIRSTANAYASMILLPAGRATGEVARAATLMGEAGLRHATAASTRLQASALLANAVISVAGAAVAAWHGRDFWPLAIGLALNAVACVIGGLGILVLARSVRVRRWLGGLAKRFFGSYDEDEPPAPSGSIATAVALCTVGRLVQTAQYGVVVLAVGGVVTSGSALLAQGIHLVGAAIGDLVPNQMGATEGAYRAFAATIGLGSEPARAISIALLVRITQLGLALFSLVLPLVLPRQERAEATP